MADQKISALTSATTPLAGTEVLPIVQSSTTVKVAVSNLTAGRAVSVGSLDSAGDAVIGTTNASLTQLGLTTTGEAADQKTWRFQTGTGIGAGILRLRALNDAATSGQNAWLVNRTAENIDSQNFLTGGSNRLSIGATDVTVNTGNLVIGTSGKGIDFSATPGTGTSELLADYEEGTWTPTLTPSTSGTITLGSPNACAYTKIGRVVTVNGLIDTASVSAPVGTTVSFNNLPFTSNATGTQRSAGTAVGFALSSGVVLATCTIVSSTTTFVVQINASLFQTGSQVYFQLSYTV